ncbi:unnamed protein product [Symbiodinium sp. KB8]|nr:unnamed protein product [Symbiodinium sp. KB8]
MPRMRPQAPMKALLCPKSFPKPKTGSSSAVASMLAKGCRSLLDGRPGNVSDSGEGWPAAAPLPMFLLRLSGQKLQKDGSCTVSVISQRAPRAVACRSSACTHAAGLSE